MLEDPVERLTARVFQEADENSPGKKIARKERSQGGVLGEHRLRKSGDAKIFTQKQRLKEMVSRKKNSKNSDRRHVVNIHKQNSHDDLHLCQIKPLLPELDTTLCVMGIPTRERLTRRATHRKLGRTSTEPRNSEYFQRAPLEVPSREYTSLDVSASTSASTSTSSYPSTSASTSTSTPHPQLQRSSLYFERRRNRSKLPLSPVAAVFKPEGASSLYQVETPPPSPMPRRLETALSAPVLASAASLSPVNLGVEIAAMIPEEAHWNPLETTDQDNEGHRLSTSSSAFDTPMVYVTELDTEPTLTKTHSSPPIKGKRGGRARPRRSSDGILCQPGRGDHKSWEESLNSFVEGRSAVANTAELVLRRACQRLVSVTQEALKEVLLEERAAHVHPPSPASTHKQLRHFHTTLMRVNDIWLYLCEHFTALEAARMWAPLCPPALTPPRETDEFGATPQHLQLTSSGEFRSSSESADDSWHSRPRMRRKSAVRKFEGKNKLDQLNERESVTPSTAESPMSTSECIFSAIEDFGRCPFVSDVVQNAGECLLAMFELCVRSAVETLESSWVDNLKQAPELMGHLLEMMMDEALEMRSLLHRWVHDTTSGNTPGKGEELRHPISSTSLKSLSSLAALSVSSSLPSFSFAAHLKAETCKSSPHIFKLNQMCELLASLMGTMNLAVVQASRHLVATDLNRWTQCKPCSRASSSPTHPSSSAEPWGAHNHTMPLIQWALELTNSLSHRINQDWPLQRIVLVNSIKQLVLESSVGVSQILQSCTAPEASAGAAPATLLEEAWEDEEFFYLDAGAEEEEDQDDQDQPRRFPVSLDQPDASTSKSDGGEWDKDSALSDANAIMDVTDVLLELGHKAMEFAPDDDADLQDELRYAMGECHFQMALCFSLFAASWRKHLVGLGPSQLANVQELALHAVMHVHKLKQSDITHSLHESQTFKLRESTEKAVNVLTKTERLRAELKAEHFADPNASLISPAAQNPIRMSSELSDLFSLEPSLLEQSSRAEEEMTERLEKLQVFTSPAKCRSFADLNENMKLNESATPTNKVIHKSPSFGSLRSEPSYAADLSTYRGFSPAPETRSVGNNTDIQASVKGDDFWECEWPELVKVIGSGSFGTTYVAKWHMAHVAVKVMKVEGGALGFGDKDEEDENSKTFFREVNFHRMLHHPNVVRFLGATVRGPTPGARPALLLELCDTSLMELLTRCRERKPPYHSRNPLSWSRRLRLALDAARGMAYLHAKNVMHNDLKSANLLVDPAGQLKVCDFGMSRILGRQNPESEFHSPAWMAPEVLRGEDYNASADVYSFGVVLWELATLEIPWDGVPSHGIVYRKTEENERLLLTASQPDALNGPPAMEEYRELAEQCVRANPAERPSFPACTLLLETLYKRTKRLQQQRAQASPNSAGSSAANNNNSGSSAV